MSQAAPSMIVVCARCGTPQWVSGEDFECLVCSNAKRLVVNPDTLIAAYYETVIRDTAVLQAAIYYLRGRLENKHVTVEESGKRAGVSRWSVYRGLSKLEQAIGRRAAEAQNRTTQGVNNEPHRVDRQPGT